MHVIIMNDKQHNHTETQFLHGKSKRKKPRDLVQYQTNPLKRQVTRIDSVILKDTNPHTLVVASTPSKLHC